MITQPVLTLVFCRCKHLLVVGGGATGASIPRLCNHPDLGLAGSCRFCVVVPVVQENYFAATAAFRLAMVADSASIALATMLANVASPV